MGKAKKRKVADFHKPKLKVGKRKPVGMNLTNTTFKTSSIHLTPQLQQSDEPTTSRNLTIKDLLSHLNHYNVTIRHEALIGFRELFQKHPDVMHEQVNAWLTKVLDKITDIDPAVRHSLQLCLNHVFAELSAIEITPFVNILVAHICCGMTHINEGVQMDALSILELVLEKFPKLFIPYSSKIMTSLTNLICKQGRRETSTSQTLNASKVNAGISKIVSREISITVEGKMSSLKARANILDKLLKILQVIVQQMLPTEDKTSPPTGSTWNRKPIESMVPTIKVKTDSVTYARILRPQVWEQEISFEELISFGSSKTSEETMIGFLKDIYPVLLNCWVEYEPGQLASGLNDSSSIRVSVQGMKDIVNILGILMSLCEGKPENCFLFQGIFAKEFTSHFLRYFTLPLTFHTMRNKSISKKERADTLQQFSISFNFVMAKAVILLLQIAKNIANVNSNRKTNNNKDFELEEKSKLRYVKQLSLFFTLILDNSGMMDKDMIEQFLGIFMDALKLSESLTDKESQFLEKNVIVLKLVTCFSQASVTSPWKILLIQFFNVLCCERRIDFKGNEIQSFVRNVIKEMWSYPSTSLELHKVSIQFVKMTMVYQLFKNNTNINKELEKTMIKITEPSHGLYQHLLDDVFKAVIETLYSMTSLPQQLLRHVAYLCHSRCMSTETKKYMISIICLRKDERFSSHLESPFSIEELISFILSVILNYSVDELKKMNNDQKCPMSWSLLNLFNDSNENSIVEYAIKQLKNLHGYEIIWTKLISSIGDLLVMLRHLPVSTACGLLKLLNKTSKWREKSEANVEVHTVNSKINQIADLLSAILLYTVSERYKKSVSVKEARRENEAENDLFVNTIALISRNEIIFRQLVKKWINIIREYDMDGNCGNCISEVVNALLENVDAKLRPELLSILDILKFRTWNERKLAVSF